MGQDGSQWAGSRMLVVPCRQSMRVNTKYCLYYCPAHRKHKDAKFLGLYSNKAVRHLGLIGKVIVCQQIDLEGRSFEVDPKPDGDERARILGTAKESCEDRDNSDWHITSHVKYYLCDEMVETDFRKISPFGIRGHRYFDLHHVLGCDALPHSLEEIGKQLKRQTWE